MELEEIFTADVLGRLKEQPKKSELLESRVAILSGDSRDPRNRARRAAWDCYITAAYNVGLFESDSGRDLRRRLTSRDDSNFRGSMAECMAAWYIAGKLKWPISPRPIGKSISVLEFAIQDSVGEISVEVKAPHRKMSNEPWFGLDSDLIESAISAATKQLRADSRNLVILVPELRISLSTLRNQLTEALIASEKIRVPVGARQESEDITLFLDPSGKLTKRIKKDGPGNTRIGAVMTIEERIATGTEGIYIDHDVLIMHNPHAQKPLDSRAFGDLIQFQEIKSGKWGWSDGLGLGPGAR